MDNVTFEAEPGKILTILGHSGLGKTTLLFRIATHQISVLPEKRQVAMVFQSYAIWPNITGFDPKLLLPDEPLTNWWPLTVRAVMT